jgi:PIN domain nuclease of toxin-antitoxin system
MDDKNSQLFFSLIYTFQMQAMMQMGKLKNPMTEKVEKDMDAASMSIDMIEMLNSKTQNNLNDDEKRFVTQVLSDLKLNFVEESKKPKEKTETITEEKKPE